MTSTFVIVGASLAGAKAAETLRAEGFDGRVVLVGAEDERPYERPPLSKDYLRGEAEREKVYVHDEGFYAEHDIELRLGRTAVEPRRRRRASWRSTTASGCATTGCCSPPAPSRGGSRSRAPTSTACSTCAASRTPTRCASGSTAAARSSSSAPAGSARGRRLGAPARPRGHGDRPARGPARARARAPRSAPSTATSTPTTACRCCSGPASRPSRATTAVERVRTSDGRELECDFVVVGVGVQPRTGLAAAGRARRRQRHPRRRAPADQRARRLRRRRRRQRPPPASTASASASSTGPTRCTRGRSPPAPCSAQPTPTTACRTSSPTSTTSAWSTRASPATWDRVVFRGDPASREFIAFWLAGDRVVAGMNVNVWDVTDPIQRLIRERVAVDDRRLADPDVAARGARRPPRTGSTA